MKEVKEAVDNLNQSVKILKEQVDTFDKLAKANTRMSEILKKMVEIYIKRGE